MPTFSLAIGRKTKRDQPLKNPAQTSAFRNHEAEISFFVWCAWRLECGELVVTSSDGGAGEIKRGLKRIVGKSVVKVEVMPPAWDLMMHFDGNLRLVVFCNHAGKKPSFNGNWQARVQRTRIIAGPGIKLEVARERGAH